MIDSALYLAQPIKFFSHRCRELGVFAAKSYLSARQVCSIFPKHLDTVYGVSISFELCRKLVLVNNSWRQPQLLRLPRNYDSIFQVSSPLENALHMISYLDQSRKILECFFSSTTSECALCARRFQRIQHSAYSAGSVYYYHEDSSSCENDDDQVMVCLREACCRPPTGDMMHEAVREDTIQNLMKFYLKHAKIFYTL